jgi:HD superfamily phosphohydrolase YqeK
MLKENGCLAWTKEPFSVLHQFTGMLFLKKKLFVKNSKILSAVCFHTTGVLKPNLFQKIVFLADKISPERKGFFVDFLRFFVSKNLFDFAYQYCLLFSW